MLGKWEKSPPGGMAYLCSKHQESSNICQGFKISSVAVEVPISSNCLKVLNNLERVRVPHLHDGSSEISEGDKNFSGSGGSYDDFGTYGDS